VVQELGVHHETLRMNAAAPMNPASVMKLVTTYAALEQLGPAYRWKTEAYIAGTLQDGLLEGDLILRGGGDPKLDLEALSRLVRALRGKGLREIRGSLVVDRSQFALTGSDAARFDGDSFRPYNVLTDALTAGERRRDRVRARGWRGARLRRAAPAGAGTRQLAEAFRRRLPGGPAFAKPQAHLRDGAAARHILRAISCKLRREGPQRRAAGTERPGGGRVPAILERERRHLERQRARRIRAVRRETDSHA
jgi:hypothetical protein